ncbi:unnamed protein product [Lota lota]
MNGKKQTPREQGNKPPLSRPLAQSIHRRSARVVAGGTVGKGILGVWEVLSYAYNPPPPPPPRLQWTIPEQTAQPTRACLRAERPIPLGRVGMCPLFLLVGSKGGV